MVSVVIGSTQRSSFMIDKSIAPANFGESDGLLRENAFDPVGFKTVGVENMPSLLA